MIKNNVVLILGAGTSAPYGFPLGAKLMSEVVNRLKGVGISIYFTTAICR